MLARLQQIFCLSTLVAFAAWTWYFSSRGSVFAAVLGPAFIGLAYVGTIGLEFFLLLRSYADRADAPALSQLASAWASEVIAAPKVFLWRQPFRHDVIPDRIPAGSSTRGVVLLHGFVCNRGLWNPLMATLRETAAPFIGLSLEPVFGSIDDYVDQIEGAVRRLEHATGMAPVLVAHSMGGLAARAWLAEASSHGRAHRVVTIGTPHAGTAVASHAYTTNTRQMRVGSAWLEALAGGENFKTYQRFTCFWSRCDNIVFPTQSATLAGADNRQLDATPHVRMVYHRDVIAEVLRLVGQI